MVCWGWGERGRLGNNDRAATVHYEPVPVLTQDGLSVLPDVSFIAAGGHHTCAIAGFQRWCWGRNEQGQLGLGTTTDAATPQPVTFANPLVTGRTYYAPASEGGPGISDATFMTGCTTTNCTDQTSYVDVNEGASYRYMIQSDGGPTNLFPKIGVLSGTRTMGFFVDGALVQNVTSNATLTPRPAGAEVGPIMVNFTPGYHSVEFRDLGNTLALQEFDMLDLRVAGLPGANCFDALQNQNETDVDCGGVCGACGVGQSCSANNDCLSNVCGSDNKCTAPPVTPPSSSPCASFCANPQIIHVNGDYQSHDLGTGAICRETTDLTNGGNCGNMSNGRTLKVNGVTEPCNNQNWASLPAKVNGGYCVQVTPGLQSYAYFVLYK